MRVCLLIGLLLAANSILAADPQIPAKGLAWIWDQPDATSNDPRYFRGVFELKAKPTAAELGITVDNRYVVYLNGQKLGGDDSWNSVESYDVLPHLVVGKNVIAVEARNAGGQAGMIAWLKTTDADKKSTLVGSGADWKVSLTAAENWTKAEFDDQSWAKAAVLGGPEIGPWNLVGGGSSGGDSNVTDRKITTYRPADEEHKAFELPEGFAIELIAAEPLVINPVCVTQDARGRIYVSESHTYRFGPSGSPVKTPTNPIVRLDRQPDGTLKRTLVAEGFDDPVMGMAIKGGKLWCTANNFLYRFDLTEEGPAKNREQLLVDKNKAWNPFGMFVLEWGPDGLLYLSVGNHAIDIRGPDGGITGRGGSGIVVRMKPDGTKLERLVHGLRVPYSFEYDPFGQLWQLSNGEGNPNRFVRVIDGVDYHCYSRPAANNEWLAGRHPLAPPCFELPRGANTQLVRYYAAAYPAEYQGNLFLDNWGAHGFGGPNRTIFRYIPDENGQIVEKQPWLVCRDPHFRCSHLVPDHNGELLIADWYGRDDESDLTGRLWRVKYVGSNASPAAKEPPQLAAGDAAAIDALGSPQHLLREQAIERLAGSSGALDRLKQLAAESKNPLQAAGALWASLRTDGAEKWAAISAGAKNGDPRVRRLALHLLRKNAPPDQRALVEGTAVPATIDKSPSVQLEAALATGDPSVRGAFITIALIGGAAADPYLRYEAAWHFAKCADQAGLTKLIGADEEELRLAGLIAIDIACYENFETKPVALAALAELLQEPGKNEWDLVLSLAQMNHDPKLIPALEKLLTREDIPAEVTARAILTLRSQTPLGGQQLGAAATRRFLAAVALGRVRPSSPGDHLMLLELLSAEGPTPFALKEVAARLTDNNANIREAAHNLARQFQAKAAPLSSSLWKRLLDQTQKIKSEDRMQIAVTLQAIEATPDAERWCRALTECEPAVVRDLVRSWRTFGRESPLVATLKDSAPALVKKDETLAADLAEVFAFLGVSPGPAATDEVALRQQLLESKSGEHAVALGRRVFERAQCVRCHTTINANALRAPSLQGIGKAQKRDYLVESLFEPSKIIKTGFETELIRTTNDEVLSGLVKEDGDHLRVITVDNERRIAKTDIDERAVQKKSLMPEGLFKGLSPAELADLLAYLESLK